MKFNVTLQKKDQATETRIIEAESRFAVYADVQREGSTVLDIEEAPSSRARLTLNRPVWTARSVPRIDIAHMAKNLSTMLAAGLTLSRGLSVIERETTNTLLKEVARSLALHVEKGQPFYEALMQYPSIFPDLFVAMVRVGEESGSLANVLAEVGTQMESADTLAHKVRGALIYPCVVLVAIVIVAILMLLFVVPALTETLKQLHAELPLATRVFISLSDFVVQHWLLIVTFCVLLAGGAPIFFRSARGKLLALEIGLRIPVVSEIIREAYAARTARALSSLLSANVPVLEALALLKAVVGTPIFSKAIDASVDAVKKGESLSKAFTDPSSRYPILFGEMMAVGEETGKVAPMLKDAAEYYETNVSTATKDLTTIIEPILMLLIGAVVGIFAVSMIAPIYSISSAL